MKRFKSKFAFAMIGAMFATVSYAGNPGPAMPSGADNASPASGVVGGTVALNGGIFTVLTDALQAGADHLVAEQCGNGGWSWVHGCAGTFHNITAPIGWGLMDAFGSTGDPAHLQAAIDGGDFDLTSTWPGGESRFGSFTPAFMYRLSSMTGTSTYSDFAATKFFDELTAGTYGDNDWDTAGFITALQNARSGGLINLRPWDFQNLAWVAGRIGNADSTTPADGVSQQQMFLEAMLDGLNTLDKSCPSFGDLIGLAGGVRGLAMNGTTVFPPINSPNHPDINGINNLGDLANVLAGYQNADGSWNWCTSLASPVEEDKDVQDVAYTVMALAAADPLVGPSFGGAVSKGRDWLLASQLGTGGWSFVPSEPAFGEIDEVEGEALSALAAARRDATIPTVSAWGLITLALLLLTGLKIKFGRSASRRRTPV